MPPNSPGIDWRRRLVAWAEAEAPAGTRYVIGGTPVFLADIRLCCDGQDAIMAYYCTLEPGHEGKCWCSNKQVEFVPTNRRREQEDAGREDHS